MNMEEDLLISRALLELHEINKKVDELYYSKFPASCPKCGSLNVIVTGTTPKRVKYLCRDCGEKFQKAKDKLPHVLSNDNVEPFETPPQS